MIKKFVPVLLLAMPFTGNAQLRVAAPGGAILTIGSGSFMAVTGNVVALNDIGGTGALVLNGSAIQNLDMAGKQLANLKVYNAAGVNMVSDATIAGSLAFTAGILYCNNKVLTMLPAATITGYSAGKFVSTSDTLNNAGTAGGLKITVPAGMQVLAPVGADSKKFVPVTIHNNAGPDEQFTVRPLPLPVPGIDVSKTLKISWNIKEGTPSGNTVGLTIQWVAASEPAGFNRNSMKIVRSSGGAIVQKTGLLAAAGAGPFTATGGAFTNTSLFGATSDPNAFSLATANPVVTENLAAAENISMYPTLVQGNTATLVITAPVERKYVYIISDMTGKAVARKELALWKGGNTVPVVLPALADGMYTINVYDGNILKKSIKFIKGK